VSVVLISCFAVSAQKGKDVPATVTAAFAKKFPGATGVKWGKENDKEWEGEFKMNGREYSANFDSEGAWMETEYEITMKEVPTAVKATLDKESAGYKIDESEVSESKDGKIYEFVLKKGKSGIELSIEPGGKLLKKEAVKETDEK
jgi:hypothetical protein